MLAPPRRVLRVAGGSLTLGGPGTRPLVMGVVNATVDSFSDGGRYRTLDDRVALGEALLEAGADLLDVGGESGVGNRPLAEAEDEAERVVALIERLVGDFGATVSVDTYKPLVAERAVAAGAAIVNDVSGLRDPELAAVCAHTGAGLVLMHTRRPPKQVLYDPGAYADVVADVEAFLRERMAVALDRGVGVDQIVLDPGPDFTKTPAQTIACLQSLERLHGLGRPLLAAVSRKDFIGALNRRAPRERLAGTLAAVGWAADAGAHFVRVHDVAEVVDYLTVRAALRGDEPVDPRLGLDEPDDRRYAQ